jgi:hypothetical protein
MHKSFVSCHLQCRNPKSASISGVTITARALSLRAPPHLSAPLHLRRRAMSAPYTRVVVPCRSATPSSTWMAACLSISSPRACELRLSSGSTTSRRTSSPPGAGELRLTFCLLEMRDTMSVSTSCGCRGGREASSRPPCSCLCRLAPSLSCVTPHVSKPHDYVNHMFMRL